MANYIEAYRELGRMMVEGKLKEDQFIDALTDFGLDRRHGKCDGWGLAGFVRNIDRWLESAKGREMVYLTCDECGRDIACQRSARLDNRNCPCGGLNVSDDQATRKANGTWEPPGKSEMPTMAELKEALARAEESGNTALVRIVKAQMGRVSNEELHTGTVRGSTGENRS